VKNIRKLWHAGISHQWSSGKNDFLDPHDAAKEKVQWILKNHHPKPLDKGVAKELKKIIVSAEKELVH
jgi:trimethylamine:corrinoid methyltransferase-like protein